MAKRERQQKNDDPRLQSIWRAALGRPEGVRLPCKDEGEAKRLRFALYNAVRHLRVLEPAATVDTTLAEAVKNCSISLIESTVLLVQDKQFSPLMAVVNKALEEYNIPVKSEVADAAARSFEKLKAMGMVTEEGQAEATTQQTEEEEMRERARAKADAYYGKR